jgi:flagellar hook-associated protein 2
VDGLDVAGTIGGTTATGSGKFLTAGGAATGLRLLIEGNTLGDRGVVNFTRGYANQLSGLLGNILGTDNIFDSIDKSLNDSVDRLNVQREKIAFRSDALQKRLLAQFGAMDALISQLQNTGNYLTQQLDSISNISIKKK